MRTIPFGQIKLQGSVVLICMRMDQSGPGQGNTTHVSQLTSGSESTISFLPKTKDCVFLARAETQKMSHQSVVDHQAEEHRGRPTQSGAEWKRAELRYYILCYLSKIRKKWILVSGHRNFRQDIVALWVVCSSQKRLIAKFSGILKATANIVITKS